MIRSKFLVDRGRDLWNVAERAAARAGAGPDSEDIAQDTLVLLLEKYNAMENYGQIASLAAGIARRLCANLRRARERRNQRELEYSHRYASSGPASQPFPGATHCLSAGERELLRLLELGADVKSIAAGSGLGTSTVYGRIRALRQKLTTTRARGMTRR